MIDYDPTANAEDAILVEQNRKNTELKMWLAIRTDLNMSPGKLAVQSGHAFGGLYSGLDYSILRRYREGASPKVAVQVDGEVALRQVQTEAWRLGIGAYLVIDAGRTELEPGTPTVCAFGPARRIDLSSFLKRLRLL